MVNTLYIALLRGINVGGGNIIRMVDLKACFEANRMKNVATYIQGGNVVFESGVADHSRLTDKLEKALSKAFKPYEARIVLRSHERLAQIVRKAPKGFGSEPQKYRYDVIYVKEPLTVADALKSVTTKPGVDQVAAGPDVLYFLRLTAKATQSHLSRIVGLPVYQGMTVRNWNTTCKVLALMDARSGQVA